MAKVYEFLADGFEDIEALTVVDVFRRGGVAIQTVSVMEREWVETSHGVMVKADLVFEDVDFSDADLLLLPGGLEGSVNLKNHEGLKQVLMAQAAAGKRIGAICAAPMVLAAHGLLDGKKATCYPGFEKYLPHAEYTGSLVQEDGNITTGEGPAASLPYAYTLLGYFVDEAKVEEVKGGMLYPHLMAQ